jgi:plasmid stabilization system protein ParE
MEMQGIRRLTIAGLLLAGLAPAGITAFTIDSQGAEAARQQSRTLRASLAALADAHHISIELHPAIRVTRQVAPAVNLADAEVALRTLLHGYDLFLQYAGASDARPGRLERVWVFPRGTADRLRIVREEDVSINSSPTDLSTALNDALTRSIEEAEGVATRALDDPDENVRQQALEAILRETLPVAEHVLEGLFLGDPSDTVRAAAFDALAARAVADGVDVTPTLDRALQDPSPLVNDRARALRESLGTPPGAAVKPGGRE